MLKATLIENFQMLNFNIINFMQIFNQQNGIIMKKDNFFLELLFIFSLTYQYLKINILIISGRKFHAKKP